MKEKDEMKKTAFSPFELKYNKDMIWYKKIIRTAWLQASNVIRCMSEELKGENKDISDTSEIYQGSI